MADVTESPGPQAEAPRSPFQNGVRTNGRAFNSPNWRTKSEEGAAASPSPRAQSSRFTFGRSNNQVPPAITEGRRLYVGNMPYTAKSEDVQALFTLANYNVERIDIAVDPFSGRNPSYCFVDLKSKEEAERAMAELDGHDLLGRQLKIKPGVAKSASERTQQRTDGSPRFDRNTPPTNDRWQRNDRNDRTDARPLFRPTGDQSKRVYVGGLPRVEDQETLNSNIADFFQGYTIENVSKLFTPHPSKRFEPGDHYYLFVDFSTVEEAQTAMNTLNGHDGPWGGKIRVQRARGETSKTNDESRGNHASEAAEAPVSA